MITSDQMFETSVTIPARSPFQNHTHLDDLSVLANGKTVFQFPSS